MSLSDLKFSEEEMADKSVIALADRPELSAAELKARLDSGDIRERINALIDALEDQLGGMTLLDVYDRLGSAASVKALQRHGPDQKFFAFFLNNGGIFCGTVNDMLSMMNGKFVPVWEKQEEANT